MAIWAMPCGKVCERFVSAEPTLQISVSFPAQRRLCIDLADGAIRWQVSIGDVVYGSPFLVEPSRNPALCIATRRGKLFFLDARDGSAISTSAQLEGEVFSSPVAWCSALVLRVAVGCRDNHVYCFALGQDEQMSSETGRAGVTTRKGCYESDLALV